MQSKILTSCLMAGVLITGGLASRAANTNAPATPPPGATGAPLQGTNGAPPRVRPLPGTVAGPMAILTEEQRASYQKNMADARTASMELSSKLQASQREITELMYSLKVDENQIRQKMMEEAKIQADIVILRAKAFANIEPPLTEEQFAKFKEATAPRSMMRPTPPAASPTTTNHSDVGGQPKP